MQGGVYNKIVDAVCEQSQVDFEEGGIDQGTLELLKSVGQDLIWLSCARRSSVAIRGYSQRSILVLNHFHKTLAVVLTLKMLLWQMVVAGLLCCTQSDTGAGWGRTGVLEGAGRLRVNFIPACASQISRLHYRSYPSHLNSFRHTRYF